VTGRAGLFDTFVVAWLLLAVIVFVALFFVTAPYGRHARRGFGPLLPASFGWLAMEAVSAAAFAACFAVGPFNRDPAAWVFFALWEIHYVHRAFIYPWMLHEDGRRMPLGVVAMAVVFNSVNGFINGRWLFGLSGAYGASWLADPRFVAGLVLFVAGFVINRRADETLRRLRAPGETTYGVPHGGLYRWISCPNYLGEIVEWLGWALATWSLPGLAFAVWTAANLAPRARANHRWYRSTFADYPAERRALVPRVW
jgi:3-oxo-5-alpha-steroid 4-dehydrogenase 1